MGINLRKALCGLLACGLLAGVLPVAAGAASTPFYDVPANAWYADAVQFVYANKLMSGVDATFFGPEVEASRGQIVTILYRMTGQPAVTGKNSFTDVPASAYYYNAVTWASNAGIVSGFGTGEFVPNGAVSREQMAVILYRYAAYLKYDVSKSADLSGFEDQWQISEYAKPAVSWAVGSGLMNGTAGQTFCPSLLASRSVLAATLMRFCALYNVKMPPVTAVASAPAAAPAAAAATTTIKDEAVPKVSVPLASGASVSVVTLDGSTIQTPKMTFQWPVQGKISSGYGSRFIFGTTSFHRGIDIPAPLGTGVHAGQAGTVSFVGEQGSYGNLVILDHGNGFQSYYAHNSKLLVEKGDVVQKNQIIAAVGSTGRSTGNHCHFEVHYKGQVVDPMAYLPATNDAPVNKTVAVVEEPAEVMDAEEMTQEMLILAAVY